MEAKFYKYSIVKEEARANFQCLLHCEIKQ